MKLKMKKISIINIALMLSSCSCVSLNRVMTYAVNVKHNKAAVATKNLDITDKPKRVGEWTYDPQPMPLSNIPNSLMCFSMKTWNERLKPKLKFISREYRDRDNKNLDDENFDY